MNKICLYVYKKGSNKGIRCNEFALSNCNFCKKHKNSSTNNIITKIHIPNSVIISKSNTSSSSIKPLVHVTKKFVQILEENNEQNNTNNNNTNNTNNNNTNNNNTNNTSTSSSSSMSSLSEISSIVNKKIQEETLRQRIIDLETSLSNKLVIMKHFHNMKRSDSNSSEYYKNQIFVDLAISYPWNTYFNISNNISKFKDIPTFLEKVKEQLDQDIYGMENVKNEILNVICKFITNPNGTRNNIALYGKAGIAKSKIVKTLSKVLDIPIKTISLGGIKDSSFFLGHGYVYVESGPGKIIQNVIDSKISNPILYFDELDKVSETDNGKDIYSFLCYLTDTTQNNEFSDHYFYGMKFDLSKIFYIFTFNDISKIDKILLDRLNIIHVDTPNDKDIIYILKNYNIPEIIQNIGIKHNINLHDDDVETIIKYCNQYVDKNTSSGIREYYRVIEKIFLEINKNILLGKINFNTKDIILEKNIFKNCFAIIKNQIIKNLTSHPIIDHMYI